MSNKKHRNMEVRRLSATELRTRRDNANRRAEEAAKAGRKWEEGEARAEAQECGYELKAREALQAGLKARLYPAQGA